jgi:orotate phosphoribosyltransferase
MDLIRKTYRNNLLCSLHDKAYEKREVVLASGRKSNFYVDCRRVLLTPDGAFQVAHLLYFYLKDECPEADGIGGMAVGAVPLVVGALHTSFSYLKPPYMQGFFVRKTAKEHGTSLKIEMSADMKPKAAVVLIDDVVTSGGSLLACADVAESAGLRPILAFALVDREEGGAEKIRERMPFKAMFTASEIKQGPSLD